MIELAIQRIKLLDASTLGLFLMSDGRPEYFTLEDKVREISGVPVEQWKLPGITAIPVGRFKLIMDMSQRFNQEMPHILNVPGFDGIRLHGYADLATAANTEGCPLLGFSANMLAGNVSQSLAASGAFRDKLRELLKSDEVWISVRNPQ